jgi:oxygen-independent coproporphyrinogen-3 oxidase
MPPASSEKTEVGSYFISNYPPFSLWRPELVPLAEEALRTAPRPGTDLGLYLHIPFCRKRCNFCYFRVYTDKNSHEVERYVAALEREVELLEAQPALAGRRLRFAYFGGGTPSFLSEKQLESLVSRLRRHVSWDGAEEVTFECEPGTLTERKLRVIREMGVTRLSLGVESTNDAILEENGRAHRSAEVFRAYGWARDAGFPQVNVDLIAGMVGETTANWRDCVQKTLDLAPDSVTIYQLELPWNAIYSKSLGDIPVADWPQKREWLDHAFSIFEAAGYHVSSAYTLVRRKEDRFVYRDAVWHGADMVGTGVASFSHLGGVHYQNVDGFDEYASRLEAGRLPLGRALRPTPHQLLIRELVLQMKLGRLESAYFAAKFGVDILEELQSTWEQLEREKILAIEPGGVRLTRFGLLRVDSILPRFFEPEHRGARYT